MPALRRGPVAMQPTLETLLQAVETADLQPVYLVVGDRALAEPAGERLAAALAARSGCSVDVHRRPASLAPLLADLRTFSLFGSAKVLLGVETAILADRSAAADLIDEACEVLPLSGDGVTLAGRARRAASALLHALRLFGLDPEAGDPEALLDALPVWALQGGTRFRRRRRGRGRSRRQADDLKRDLASLVTAGRAAGLRGASEGDLADLAELVTQGLPPGHALVLAESLVAAEHPLTRSLAERGAVVEVGRLEAKRGGGVAGLENLKKELERSTKTRIDPDALALLARRTLRREGRGAGIEAASTERLAGEFRKLSMLASGGRIDRRLVEESVQDRGDEDVWQILDAVGAGRGEEALARVRRLLASAEDVVTARLSFFGLLAGFCRHLTAVSGLMRLFEVEAGERSYPRFRSRLAPRLQAELPGSAPNPIASLHPFRLHKAYLAASRLPPAMLANLPWRVLEVERQLKGESRDADTALLVLMAELAAGSGRSAPERGA